MYEVSSSPENGNEFYSFASDLNPLLAAIQVIPQSGLLANSHVSATYQTELNYSLRHGGGGRGQQNLNPGNKGDPR